MRFVTNKTMAMLFMLVAMFALRMTSAQTPSPAVNQSATAAIMKVLQSQREAWNRGDLESFMQGYARSEKTTFVSGDEVTRGWETVMDRYKAKYSDREKMGKLKFSELEIMPLGADAAVVLGHWELTRAKDHPHGRFTLIFRRQPEGWRIVQDHTSSAEK